MSKISMSVAQPTSDLAAAKLIRQVTGFSFSSIIGCLQNGSAGIFYKAELFLNDHLDKEEEIRELLHGFHNLGLEVCIMEFPFDEKQIDVKNFEKYRIHESDLINILNETKTRCQ